MSLLGLVCENSGATCEESVFGCCHDKLRCKKHFEAYVNSRIIQSASYLATEIVFEALLNKAQIAANRVMLQVTHMRYMETGGGVDA